jgi:hypothetical protein
MYTLRDKICDLESKISQLKCLLHTDGVTLDTQIYDYDYSPVQYADGNINVCYTVSKNNNGESIVIFTEL